MKLATTCLIGFTLASFFTIMIKISNISNNFYQIKATNQKIHDMNGD